MNISSGLLNKVLDTGIATAFTTPVMEIRAGSPPDDADSATQGSLICTVDLPDTGYFTSASGGVVSLNGLWEGTAQIDGTAGWFRIKNSADGGSSSTTLPRIDGTVSDTFGDIILSSVSIVALDTVTISGFAVGISRAVLRASGTGTFLNP